MMDRYDVIAGGILICVFLEIGMMIFVVLRAIVCALIG